MQNSCNVSPRGSTATSLQGGSPSPTCGPPDARGSPPAKEARNLGILP